MPSVSGVAMGSSMEGDLGTLSNYMKKLVKYVFIKLYMKVFLLFPRPPILISTKYQGSFTYGLNFESAIEAVKA